MKNKSNLNKATKKIVILGMLLIVATLLFSNFSSALTITEEHIVLCDVQPNSIVKTIPTFELDENLSNVFIELVSSQASFLAAPVEQTIINYTANTPINLGNATLQSACTKEEVGTIKIKINNEGNLYDEGTAYSISAVPPGTTNPPNIITYGPSGDLESSAVLLTTTTDQDTTCKYDLTYSNYNSMQYTFTGTQTEHTAALYLEQGEHSFKVVCQNTAGIISLPRTIQFTINSPEPQLNSYSPHTYNTNWDEIVKLNTINSKTCYYTYDLNLDDTNSMNTATDISQTHHEIYFDKDYTQMKIICENEYGKKSASQIITISPEAKNTAVVIMDTNEITSGIFEVNVLFDKEVENPHLTYKLISSGISRTIPLEGNKKDWHGLFIIEDSTAKQIGEFELTDMNENYISITNGKSFIVDPVKPQKVTSVKINQKETNVFIEWKAPTTDVQSYNIYRKENNTYVDEFDLYNTTNSENYLDEQVNIGSSYSYRIAPVDKTGNEGLLSLVYTIKVEKLYVKEETKKLSTFELKVISDLQKQINELETQLKDKRESIGDPTIITSYAPQIDIDGNSLIKIQNKINNILSNSEIQENDVDVIKSSIEKIKFNIKNYPISIEKGAKSDVIISVYKNDYYDDEVLESKRLEHTSENYKTIKNMRLNEKESLNLIEAKLNEIIIKYNNKTETFYELETKVKANDSIFFIILPNTIHSENIISIEDNNPRIENENKIAIKVANKNNLKITLDKKIENIEAVIYVNKQIENKITGNITGLRKVSGKIWIIIVFIIISMGLAVNLFYGYKERENIGLLEQKDFQTKYLLPVGSSQSIKIGKNSIRSIYDLYEIINKSTKKQFVTLTSKRNKNKLSKFIEQEIGNVNLATAFMQVTNKEEAKTIIQDHCKKKGLVRWFQKK